MSKDPRCLAFGGVAEMTLPQTIFVLNDGRMPNPGRREFRNQAEAQRYMDETLSKKNNH